MASIKVFQGYQTKDAEDFLDEKLGRFALLALGKVEPEHHNNSKKCKAADSMSASTVYRIKFYSFSLCCIVGRIFITSVELTDLFNLLA
jgi:hypothetical protein